MELHITAYREIYRGNMALTECNVALRKEHWQRVFWAFKKYLAHSDGERDSI